MKKLPHIFALSMAVIMLATSLSACGGSASQTANSQTQPEASASSVAQIVEDTTPQSMPMPDTKQEETVHGSVIGSSGDNLTLMTKDGVTVVFPIVDAEMKNVGALNEGDWVTVTYKGTIADDMAAVEVISVEDNTDEAKEEADATKFADAKNATMFTTGPINVRAGYSTNYKVVATLAKGTEVEVLGKAQNGWKQIKYNGREYYMFGKYLTDTAPEKGLDDATGLTAQTTNGTVYTTVGLRMRDEPAVAGHVLGVSPKGTALIKKGIIGDWIQVEYDGGVAYCDSEYITTAPQSETVVTISEGLPQGVEKTIADMTMYTTFALHMRSTCTTNAVIIGTEPKGGAVHVTGTLNNGWYEVQYAGRTAYCVAQFLTDKKPSATNASASMTDCKDSVWSITKLNVRETPSLGGVLSTTVPTGTQLDRTGVSEDGKWSRVDYNGNTLYVATQYVTTKEMPSKAEAPTVQNTNQTKRTTADLRMHASASLDSQVLGVVKNGGTVTRIGILSNGWSQVKYNGVTAYCASEYLA